MRKSLVYWMMALLFAVYFPSAHAYIGLCCAKCGGNIPMNIPGGGIPKTKQFRFLLSHVFESL
jgi:hypothetical protein